jgi:hypothetical protein
MHTCQFKDPGHESIFHILVKELHSWLAKMLGEHSVAATVEAYLLTRGGITMVNCVHDSNEDLVGQYP